MLGQAHRALPPLGSPPLYDDAVPIARALIEAAPDRVIWGSDYPFLSHADRVNAVSLFNLIPTWVPDAATRKRTPRRQPAKTVRLLMGVRGRGSCSVSKRLPAVTPE